jgi:hypothetical protein
MAKKKAKNRVSAADPRPKFYECKSSEEFWRLCERKRAGELTLWHIDAGDPRTGILWTVEVLYSQPYREQLNIL